MVAVVVPWLGGCSHRERAWRWVREQYRTHHPDWQIILAPGPKPWCKAEAVGPAIDATDAEVVVVADADCWSEGIGKAVTALSDAPWAVPHTTVYRLSEEGTADLLRGGTWKSQPLDQRPYRGVAAGGIVVAARETFQAIPLDPRFIGWGQEDISHSIALYCLLGRPWRGEAPLIHLWHPPQPRMNRKVGSREGWALYRRYLAAKRDPNLMAQLLKEAHVHRNARQPKLHAAPAQ